MNVLDQLVRCTIEPKSSVEFARDAVERSLNLHGVLVRKMDSKLYLYVIGAQVIAEGRLYEDALTWNRTPEKRIKQLVFSHYALLEA